MKLRLRPDQVKAIMSAMALIAYLEVPELVEESDRVEADRILRDICNQTGFPFKEYKQAALTELTSIYKISDPMQNKVEGAPSVV